MVADELRRQADVFVDLMQLQSQIERELPADHPRNRSRDDGPGAAEEFEDDDDYYEAESA